MYEELVKGLRFCAMTDLSEEEYPCDPCEYKAPEKYHIKNKVCYLGCFQQMMLHAADAIEELQKAVLRREEESGILDELPMYQQPVGWIPVTEKLPKEEKEIYWCYTNMGIMCECRWTNNRFGFGESDKWGWNIMDVPQYQKVTHWMPLPQPPKEE